MKLEDQIKEALTRHAEDTRPDATSWDRVESKVRRGHYARVTMVSTMTVALIGAAVVVLPGLGNTKPQGNGFANTTPAAEEPSPSVSPGLLDIYTSGWTTRVGTQAGFQLLLPPDWKGGWYEGYWDFEPEDLPSLAEGGDTVAVEIHVESGDYQDLAPKNAKSTRVGDREAMAFSPSDGVYASFAVRWTDCPTGRDDCTAGSPRTLIVSIKDSTLALLQQYGPDAKGIVQTIRPYDGSTPGHGTASGIADDAYRQTLITFLDARVEGIGAEDWMCCNAPKFYAKYGLYDLGQDSLMSYAVHSVSEAASAGAATFEVTLRYENDRTRSETVSVVYESGQQNADEVPKIGDVAGEPGPSSTPT